NLLGLRGVGRDTDPAVGLPGGLGELQAAVVAVAGVDGPVATGFALRDRVPVVVGVGRGGAGGHQCQRGRGERPGDAGAQSGLADVLHVGDLPSRVTVGPYVSPTRPTASLCGTAATLRPGLPALKGTASHPAVLDHETITDQVGTCFQFMARISSVPAPRRGRP